MDALSITGTVRASLGLYNNREDIDALTRGIRRVMKLLRK
jgi:selenocysteine lyase/cysteine desulfurase